MRDTIAQISLTGTDVGSALLDEAESADTEKSTVIVSSFSVPCSSSTHTDTIPSPSPTVYSVSAMDTIRSGDQRERDNRIKTPLATDYQILQSREAKLHVLAHLTIQNRS